MLITIAQPAVEAHKRHQDGRDIIPAPVGADGKAYCPGPAASGSAPAAGTQGTSGSGTQSTNGVAQGNGTSNPKANPNGSKAPAGSGTAPSTASGTGTAPAATAPTAGQGVKGERASGRSRRRARRAVHPARAQAFTRLTPMRSRRILAAAACAAAALAAPGTALAKVPASVRVAVLLKAHPVRSYPGLDAQPTETISAQRPLTHTPTSLPILQSATTADGRRWLWVDLPGRPNGRTGWTLARDVAIDVVRWAVRVDLSARRLSVYRSGRRVRSFRVVVGRPSTPTPRGRFFVEEIVRYAKGAELGPYALALSARSTVLQEFAGGPGQIALHGRGRIGGTPGTAASHGCVRLRDGDVAWLARHVLAGTPVTVTR
ncbi:MAG: L,D-transpeptidase [Solirubrobacteraceae bacterium]